MPASAKSGSRVVSAQHGVRPIEPDPSFEKELSQHLRIRYSRAELLEQLPRFAHGEGEIDCWMRRAIWRAVARTFGDGVIIGPGVGSKHLETFCIGDGVFIGAQSYIQGRFDGTTVIGNRVWIGPQAYLDARDLILEDYVGWGPGAKVLGSAHSGSPVNIPVIQTELDIRPVRVGEGADIGTGAVLLPGVTVGRGSIIGAGSVVTRDIPPYVIAAGVPARVLRPRDPAAIDTNDKRFEGGRDL